MTKVTERKEWDVALSKAKIQLMSKADSVFFSSLCFSMKHVFSERIPTACAGGKTITYNPKFFMGLTAPERVFLMIHETMHIAYLHAERGKAMALEKNKANIAADHVINLQLIERGFTMPQGGYADRQYTGMSMEAIYKLLPDDNKKPNWEDMEEPGEDADSDDIRRDIEDAVVRAAMQSKMADDKPGTIPGEIEIFLNKLLNPKLPAKAILRKYFQSYSKADYSWRKPNRRSSPDIILPSLHSESLMDIAFAVDASGSVSDEDFTQMVSDIHSVIKHLKPEKTTIIQFDTQIHSVDVVRNIMELSRIKFAGRGGTNVNPVIEWAIINKPKVLLIFTDGGFRFPYEKPKCDVVWLIHNNPAWTAPYGKVIHYEV